MEIDFKPLADALLRGEIDKIDVRSWPNAAVCGLLDHILESLALNKRHLKGIRTDPTTFRKLGIQRDPNRNNSGLYKGVIIVESPKYFDFIEPEWTEDL